MHFLFCVHDCMWVLSPRWLPFYKIRFDKTEHLSRLFDPFQRLQFLMESPEINFKNSKIGNPVLEIFYRSFRTKHVYFRTRYPQIQSQNQQIISVGWWTYYFQNWVLSAENDVRMQYLWFPTFLGGGECWHPPLPAPSSPWFSCCSMFGWSEAESIDTKTWLHFYQLAELSVAQE